MLPISLRILKKKILPHQQHHTPQINIIISTEGYLCPGACFLKVSRTFFRLEKPVVKLQSACFRKLIF